MPTELPAEARRAGCDDDRNECCFVRRARDRNGPPSSSVEGVRRDGTGGKHASGSPGCTNATMVRQAPVWLWLFFAAVTGAAFLLDLLIHWRPMTLRRAIARSLAWIGLGLAFAFVVAGVLGIAAAQEYVASFFIEKALSLDNLVAFFVIFRELEIPATMQHRVLAAGILGAIVARALFIAAGVEVLRRWHPVVCLLATILLVASALTLAMKETRPDHRPVLTFIRGHHRFADAKSGRFFVRIGNRWRPTTLILGVVAIERPRTSSSRWTRSHPRWP